MNWNSTFDPFKGSKPLNKYKQAVKQNNDNNSNCTKSKNADVENLIASLALIFGIGYLAYRIGQINAPKIVKDKD